MITPELLRALSPGLTAAWAAEIALGLQAAARAAGITTRLRVAAFVAQLAHESGGFVYLHELWGPTAAQARYEGRRDLGNTQPGDGYRYRGRGWLQLTGRHNYRLYGALLNLPLETQPDLAAQPAVAARVAAAYWTQRNLNGLADSGDLETITRRINGGLNGWDHRQRLYRLALAALPELQPAPPDPSPPLPVPWVEVTDRAGTVLKTPLERGTYHGVRFERVPGGVRLLPPEEQP